MSAEVNRISEIVGHSMQHRFTYGFAAWLDWKGQPYFVVGKLGNLTLCKGGRCATRSHKAHAVQLLHVTTRDTQAASEEIRHCLEKQHTEGNTP